jgi:hypothetical protein
MVSSPVKKLTKILISRIVAKGAFTWTLRSFPLRLSKCCQSESLNCLVSNYRGSLRGRCAALMRPPLSWFKGSLMRCSFRAPLFAVESFSAQSRLLSCLAGRLALQAHNACYVVATSAVLIIDIRSCSHTLSSRLSGSTFHNPQIVSSN